MNQEAKNRLARMLQDLEEIEEASSDHIRCAVISSSLASPLRDVAAWQWVAKFVQETRDQNDNIVLYPKPVVVEPFTNGKGCVQWHGLSDKLDKFRAWVVRLSGFLKSNPELVSNFEPYQGVEGGLQALCAIAATVPELSILVKQRTILDLRQKPAFLGKIPEKLATMKPKPFFSVQEINVLVPRFAMKVLNHSLGKPLRAPPVRVEFGDSKSKVATVIVNDKHYVVDVVLALIVDQLLWANGNPITRNTMRASSPMLADYDHLEREIKKIRTLLPLDYDSDTRGFWLLPEWLA